MSDPSNAIQTAISNLLKADADVKAMARVYDVVPANAVFPYLQIGATQVLPATAQDYDGADVVQTIDGWSRAASRAEIKQLGAAVNAALTDADVLIDGYRLIECIIEQTQYLTDPDGKTFHGVFVFRARTEPA